MLAMMDNYSTTNLQVSYEFPTDKHQVVLLLVEEADPPALQELRELQAQLDHKVPQDRQDLRDQPEPQAQLDRQDHKVPRAYKAYRE
jgi:hypothetical protein